MSNCKMAKPTKPKIAESGDKITEEKCPNCRDKLILRMDGQSEIFICENCKFKIEKSKSRK